MVQALIATVKYIPSEPLVDFFHHAGDRYPRALRKLLSPGMNIPTIGGSDNSLFVHSSTSSPLPASAAQHIDTLIEAINQRCLQEQDQRSLCFAYREFTGQQLVHLLPPNDDERIHFLPGLVVKRVRRDVIAIEEAANMQHICQLTTIPVPQVIRVHSNFHAAYIFMSRIPGVSLEEVWQMMPTASKTRIVEQLKAVMTNLRSIYPPSPCYLGSLELHICLDA